MIECHSSCSVFKRQATAVEAAISQVVPVVSLVRFRLRSPMVNNNASPVPSIINNHKTTSRIQFELLR